MLNYSETKEMNTWEEVFYDYLCSPGWNCVRIGYKGIEYYLSWGDNIYYVDRQGEEHSFEFPQDVETMMDAHVLENGLSPRELMKRNDLDFFAMD